MSVYFVSIAVILTSIGVTAADSNLPSGFLDIVRYDKGTFYAIGWAADEKDGAPVSSVTLYVDDKAIGKAKLGMSRLDVANVYKNPNWQKSGWDISIKITLAKGTHKAYAVAVNKQGGKNRLKNEFKFSVN